MGKVPTGYIMHETVPPCEAPFGWEMDGRPMSDVVQVKASSQESRSRKEGLMIVRPFPSLETPVPTAVPGEASPEGK